MFTSPIRHYIQAARVYSASGRPGLLDWIESAEDDRERLLRKTGTFSFLNSLQALR